MKIQKFEYLENKKTLLDEIKSIFHNYLKVITWWKNEKQQTQALSFRVTEYSLGVVKFSEHEK